LCPGSQQPGRAGNASIKIDNAPMKGIAAMSSAVEEAPSAAAAVVSRTGVDPSTTHADGGDDKAQTPHLEYRNNANLIAPVRVDVTASKYLRERQITQAVRLTRPDLFVNDRPSHTYSSVSHPHWATIRQLGGGLSNHLYVVHPGGRDEAVLVRIHAEDEGVGDDVSDDDTSDDDGAGAGVSPPYSSSTPASEAVAAPTFVDREVENRILAWLSSERLAPTFHGRFINGRIEEFYDGFRPLSWDELSQARFAVPVARALASLHCAHPPEGVLTISDKQRREGEIWSRISEWLDMASNASSDAEADLVLQRTKVEWEWLQATLRPSNDAIDSASMECINLQCDSSDMYSAASTYFRHIVFAHMDCQSLNILTPCKGCLFDDDSSDAASDSKYDKDFHTEEPNLEEKGQLEEKGGECASVRLIDFEYAGLNPRAADIANTFCEYCNMNNLDPDYETQYPTDEQQDTFFRAYIATASPELAKKLNDLSGGGKSGEDGWAPFLAAARLVVGRHTLLSHIGWGIWAIAQASLSTIEFDYLKYARLRLKGYFYFKERYA
jgi:thiamine kinase-like enzyme